MSKPHGDLGRSGPICPFVPGALERKTLWLAPEQIADVGVPHVVERMKRYKRLFLDAEPTDGDDADFKVIVVVFTDLSADRAHGIFAKILQQLAVPSYVEDGIMFGPFYKGNEGTAIYNASFRPFQSPAPFIFVRRDVISDWKFFLDNQIDLVNLQFTLLPRNYAACHGAWLATRAGLRCQARLTNREYGDGDSRGRSYRSRVRAA